MALLGAAVVSGGCGDAHLEADGAEGHYIEVGDVVYQVQLSRLLNGGSRPDDNLLEGQPAATPDQQYMAVFLIIQNKSDKPYTPPKEMTVTDTQGNEYLPQDTTESGFGLSFTDAIPPGEGAPPADSPAAGGVDAASMVLYKLKNDSATTNLPLELEIPDAGQKQPSRVELDL